MFNPVIISYFTKGTLYEKDAADLCASCEKLSLEHVVEGIESFGSWDRHCCFKPAFILQKLKAIKRPVVWIDADALVLQSPTLFQTLDCDLAVRMDHEREKSDPAWVRTGTLFVNYTPAGLKLMADWTEICQMALNTKPHGHEVWDQICLKALILQGVEARIESLPGSYCAIFDAEEDRENPVIVHYQASRLYKKFINGEVAPFLDELSIEHLRDLRPKIRY